MVEFNGYKSGGKGTVTINLFKICLLEYYSPIIRLPLGKSE